jgi:hypothetical protein
VIRFLGYDPAKVVQYGPVRHRRRQSAQYLAFLQNSVFSSFSIPICFSTTRHFSSVPMSVCTLCFLNVSLCSLLKVIVFRFYLRAPARAALC